VVQERHPCDPDQPRYTGRQVWNKQRTDEVLLDVDDVAMGHTSVMRWNPREQWVISTDVVHPPIVEMDTFEQVQALLHRRGTGTGGQHKQHRARHLYVFKGALYCGLCDRRTYSHQSNGEAYYRCRYANRSPTWSPSSATSSAYYETPTPPTEPRSTSNSAYT
jgi:site-specific DNA recombinase